MISARTALVDPLGPHVASAVPSTAGQTRPCGQRWAVKYCKHCSSLPNRVWNSRTIRKCFLLKCFDVYVQGHVMSYFIRLTNIDIHKIFFGGKAIMYKKTSNISIFSCITKPKSRYVI
jgi:hypothetical protein